MDTWMDIIGLILTAICVLISCSIIFIAIISIALSLKKIWDIDKREGRIEAKVDDLIERLK